MTLRRALIAGLLAACVAVPALGADAEFRLDCAALTKAPNRLTGSANYAAAADYIHERLKAIGADVIVVQTFPAAQTRTKRCELHIEGVAQPLALSPMRPNGIIPPTTPREGVSGPIVHVGLGAAKDFGSKRVRGAVVVLDYNAGLGWMRAFRLGAKAVIFVPNGRAESIHSHIVTANANLPRFYYAGPQADLPEGKRVTIHSEVVWEGVTGRNVLGFFEGAEPAFPKEKDDTSAKDEVIILAANLDTFGEVPDRSPGARGAVNCAALLKLARSFKENRPRRHVLVAFLDAQSRAHLGSGMLYRVLEQKEKKAKLESREGSLAAETEHVNQLQKLLGHEEPLEHRSPARRELLNRLRDRAADHAFALNGIMFDLRDERLTLGRKWPKAKKEDVKDEELTPDERKARVRIRQINERVKTELQPERDKWNDLRRALGRDDTAGLAPPVKAKLRGITGEVRKRVMLRSNELESERQALAADAEVAKLLAGRKISLHVSLLLGDSTRKWGIVIGGESPMHSNSDKPGQYGKIQGTFLRAYDEMSKRNEAPKGFVVGSVDQSLRNPRVLWAAPLLAHSGEVAGLFGIYNVAFATCQERLPHEGTPDDRLDRLDLDRIESQADEIAALLTETAGRRGLSVTGGIVATQRYILPEFDDRVRGAMVMGMLEGSSVPNTPMPGAVVQVQFQQAVNAAFERLKPYAFDPFQVVRTDQNGVFSVGPLPYAGWWGFAAVFDERGQAASVSDTASHTKIHERLNVFRCRSGALALPPQLNVKKWPGFTVLALSSRSNAALDPKKSFTGAEDGIVYWWVDEREKGVKLFGLREIVGLNNEPSALDVKPRTEAERRRSTEGRGFDLEDGGLSSLRVTTRSAADLWRLNESRMAIMRAKDIRDDSLEELHGRAEGLLAAAGKETAPLKSEALSASAYWASQPVYRKTRGMLDDLVVAVLILLALSVPFAFALERMVIGATTIYRQISWFAIFFAATFVVLYLSHPAFAIANTPIIIFLGFAIVVMSVLVIAIIMRKFEVELKALQGMRATVHAVDVSRVSTFIAAMQMGISTMRRRPLRTALTAVTVILLTFTILCFASFGTRLGIVTLFSEPSPPYAGVSVHRVNWQPLGRDLLDVMHGRWGDKASIFRREWICPENQDSPGLLLTRDDGSEPVTVSGVLGIGPGEVSMRDDLGEMFGDDLKEGTVLLTRPIADSLKAQVGDTVVLHGIRLRLGRVIDSVELSAARDMDGSSILPVDFTEVSSMQQTGEQDGGEEQDAQSMLARHHWASLPADRVVVVSADTALALGAMLHAVTLYTPETGAATETAEDLTRILPFPVAATRSNGVYLHVLGTVLSASGVKDLFFPILLGGLVIFGTMLGSVADREKEIYTFSALGLAPKHVAMLFFAEAMVYSLVGGMGGYLFAQGSQKILSLLAGYGVRVPEINTSSTNTMVTILIVMATVLVSAIYPAIKASKSANPGLMRTWRPPDPKRDVLDIVFPFTVSEYDITGVVSFLKEHFDNHSDTGLGRFMAQDARLVKDGRGNLGLDASLALAPFDLGVNQTFALRSTPSEIPGIDEVQLRLERRSGQPKDWRRLNKVFLDDLRRQFLIWRSIPHETMETYRQRTLTTLGSAAPGQAEDEE
ncbi:MAG: FtsX-like permease family protein [Planctomycetota bacterium]